MQRRSFQTINPSAAQREVLRSLSLPAGRQGLTLSVVSFPLLLGGTLGTAEWVKDNMYQNFLQFDKMSLPVSTYEFEGVVYDFNFVLALMRLCTMRVSSSPGHTYCFTKQKENL